MQWVIKASKLCNLRCKYCYEWDSLSDPTRMSEGVWRRAISAVREYAELTERQLGSQIPTDIIWHGGEPLVLPVPYFARVLDIQHELLPEEWFRRGIVRNCIQTNLYSVSDAMMDLLLEHDFQIGVSVDFCPGVRVTVDGRETEDRVRRNLDRLAARGIPFELTIVLARHTVSDIPSVFQEITRFNTSVRLLPLFAGPPSRPMDGVAIAHSDILDGMMRVFDLWFENGMTPSIDPFEECLDTVILKKLQLRQPRHDRTRLGSEVLEVDRDGSVSCVASGFSRSRRIGNVLDASIGTLMQSAAYKGILEDEARLKEAVCSQCSFVGACSTRPIARWFDSASVRDCPVEKYLYPMIESYLDERGFFESDFFDVGREMLRAQAEERLTGIAVS